MIVNGIHEGMTLHVHEILNHVTYKLNGNFIFIFLTISEELATESTVLLFELDFIDNIFSKICVYFHFTLLEMVNSHNMVQDPCENYECL